MIRQVRQTILGSMVQETTCPACNGQGEVIVTPCHTCRGRGLERKVLHKTVSIPGGVDNGTQIRLGGEGQPGVFGGPNGNLISLKSRCSRTNSSSVARIIFCSI